MPRRQHFEEFQDHTRLKHFLLDVYLKQWATILITGRTRKGVQPPRLWVVDAFAGAGRDRTGAPGSPVIAAEIARAINAQHYSTPLTRATGMRVVAVEADEHRCAQLKSNLADFGDIAQVRCGTLQNFLDRFLEYSRNDPTFFFLDPFGVEGLDSSILSRIFANRQTEVLLLFSDEGAVRLAGKADAVVPTREELLAAKATPPSIFGEDFDQDQVQADRIAVERVLAGHSSNQRAEEILDRAFGGRVWRRILETTPVNQRRKAFVDLYEQILRHAGASHVLRFAVTTPAGRHKYSLLHASTHKAAFAAMKEAMHRTYRLRPAGEPAPSLFEGDTAPRSDPEFTSGVEIRDMARAVAEHFAGRQVRWTSVDRAADTVSRYAIEDTPLLFHELPLLQAELRQQGFQVSGSSGKPARPESFSFPEVRA